MIDKVLDNQCCICGACESICPQSAISYNKEIRGFYYPVIDNNLCIECNLCEKVCPTFTNWTPSEYKRVYVAKSNNLSIRRTSTSGGLFYECANRIIEDGGYVCGAIYDTTFHVRHVITNEIDTVKKMQGSKYAQSSLTGIFNGVKSLLIAGKKVLFCGCPCQNAALRSYLCKEYDNLILIDFICHGIPSSTSLEAYLNQLEKKYKSKIKKLDFRNKKYGWHNSSVYVEFFNGRKYIAPITVDPYMKAFLSGTIIRDNCMECQYKSNKSESDITLGDFWGAEVLFQDLDDNNGLSAVIINSHKGQQLIDTLDLTLNKTDIDNVVKYNRNYIESTRASNLRDKFYDYSKVHGFNCAIDHYFKETRVETCIRRIRYLLRYCFYKIKGKGRPLY